MKQKHWTPQITSTSPTFLLFIRTNQVKNVPCEFAMENDTDYILRNEFFQNNVTLALCHRKPHYTQCNKSVCRKKVAISGMKKLRMKWQRNQISHTQHRDELKIQKKNKPNSTCNEKIIFEKTLCWENRERKKILFSFTSFTRGKFLKSESTFETENDEPNWEDEKASTGNRRLCANNL